MKWHRRMYYALYASMVDVDGYGHRSANRVATYALNMPHLSNLVGLVFLVSNGRAGSLVVKGLLVLSVGVMAALMIHGLSLDGKKLRKEFESERGSAEREPSLWPYAVYVAITVIVFAVHMRWAPLASERTG
jgi:hypothetical protein